MMGYATFGQLKCCLYLSKGIGHPKHRHFIIEISKLHIHGSQLQQAPLPSINRNLAIELMQATESSAPVPSRMVLLHRSHMERDAEEPYTFSKRGHVQHDAKHKPTQSYD